MAGHLTRPRARLAAGIALVLLLGAACGGAADDDESTSPPTETTAPPAPTTTSVPPETTTTVALTPVARGQRLTEQRGCTSCHTTDGKPSVGPTWQGLSGNQVKLTGGRTVTADDTYLRRSITEPDAEIVEGFPEGVMAGAVPAGALKPDDIDAIIAYLKSL